jgi:NADPH:quinone reductase-like Zn-dependent oxidoreductase
MRAVVIADFGADPEVAELPDPEPGPGEILVRVGAAAMNPFDWKVIDGALRGVVPHSFPLVLGNDMAGFVQQAGPGVTRFQLGDRVFGQVMKVAQGRGAYGELVVASADGLLAPTPDGLSDAIAAALPTASTTAYSAVQAAGAGQGRSILVNGATGGVGLSAVQFAAGRGATVLATAAPDAAARVRDLGAHHAIDFTAGSTAEQVRAVCPDGVDAVLDLVSVPGGAGVAGLAALVRAGGSYVSTNGAADADALGARGVSAVNFSNKTTTDLLSTVAGLAASGDLRIHIDAEIPLARVPEAIAAARQGHARGKTVIIP